MASFRQIAAAAARQHFGSERDRRFFMRQMQQEAGFRDVTSPAGAQGPAQIMPGTARAWGVKNVHDPREAYGAAAAKMAGYLKKYGRWDLALAAYNAGEGSIKNGRPPRYRETQNYIATILGDNKDAKPGGTSLPAVSGGPGSRGSANEVDTKQLAAGVRQQKGQAIANWLAGRKRSPIELAMQVRDIENNQPAPPSLPSGNSGAGTNGGGGPARRPAGRLGIVGVPGTDKRIDRSILADTVAFAKHFKLKITDGYAPHGHAKGGEHPVGLALDLVPDTSRGGTWDDVDRAAAYARSRTGQGQAFRWIGYDGQPGHGRGHHLHVSFNGRQGRVGHLPDGFLQMVKQRNR